MTTTTPYERHPMQDWVPETRTLMIGGRAVEPQGETWDVFNPANEEVIATVGGASAAQVDEAVAAARGAFPAWAALSGEERSRHIHRFADVLEAAADRLLPSIVNEVGTPVSLAEYLQVKMAVDEHLRWAAEAAKVDRTIHLGGYDKPYPPERRGARAGRRRRRDHRLQLPAEPRDLQVRRGAGRRLHRASCCRRRGRR